MADADTIEGRTLPSLTLRATDGSEVRIPDAFRGAWTVIYTYPKDDTPGCTKEACSFRDNKAEFEKIGVRIYGVSLDDVASHQAFAEKFHLNFPLLADTDHQLSDALGSYGEQEFRGMKYKGLSRDTFLIDPEGRIRRVWRKVDPVTTMGEVYEEAVRQQNAG